MDVGKKIKYYREKKGISQEELADKIFVTRQTISNWENDKNYPDIKSISLLCNVFDVSLDEFIEGDIEKMKKIINEKELNDYNSLSIIFTIEFLVTLISAYPLLKFLNLIGVIIWFLLLICTLITSYKIEKIYKKNDVRTYKEIVYFTEGKNLNSKEIIEEKAKRPYQKVLLTILGGIVGIIVFIMLEILIGQ